MRSAEGSGIRRVLAAAVVLLVLGASTDARALGFGARAAYWFPDLSGDVLAAGGGIPATRIDVKDTLGVEDEDIPFGEAFLSLGRVTLRVGYTPVTYEGSRLLTEDIVFNGRTYSASGVVDTRIDLDMIDGNVEVDLFRPSVGVASINLGLMLKVKYVDAEIRLSNASVGSTIEDFKGPIPMVGVTAGVGFLGDMLRADVRVAGIGYSDNRLWDGEGYLSFSPLPLLSLQGGYRYIRLKIDEDDFFADLDIKGPYVGVQLSF